MLLYARQFRISSYFAILIAVFVQCTTFAASDPSCCSKVLDSLSSCFSRLAKCRLCEDDIDESTSFKYFMSDRVKLGGKDLGSRSSREKILSFLDGSDLAQSVAPLSTLYGKVPHQLSESITISDKFFSNSEEFERIKNVFFDKTRTPKYKKLKQLVIKDGKSHLKFNFNYARFVTRLKIFINLTLKHYKSLEKLHVLTNESVMNHTTRPLFIGSSINSDLFQNLKELNVPINSFWDFVFILSKCPNLETLFLRGNIPFDKGHIDMITRNLKNLSQNKKLVAFHFSVDLASATDNGYGVATTYEDEVKLFLQILQIFPALKSLNFNSNGMLSDRIDGIIDDEQREEFDKCFIRNIFQICPHLTYFKNNYDYNFVLTSIELTELVRNIATVKHRGKIAPKFALRKGESGYEIIENESVDNSYVENIIDEDGDTEMGY